MLIYYVDIKEPDTWMSQRFSRTTIKQKVRTNADKPPFTLMLIDQVDFKFIKSPKGTLYTLNKQSEHANDKKVKQMITLENANLFVLLINTRLFQGIHVHFYQRFSSNSMKLKFSKYVKKYCLKYRYST